MSTFVLVHGAWHGGWCWGRVRPLLQERGHDVFAPTLTGLSDRSHLLSPSVGLGTHVEDIVRLIEAENLYDVTLVGHSYAGLVISSVASRIPHRVARRVHLDAFVPRNGEAAIDLLPETIAHHYRESVEGPGFGWLIPPRSLEVRGVTAAEDLGWLTPRLTPHPWLTYTEAASLAAAEADVPGTFIEATSWMRVFEPSAQRARDRGWDVHEIATGHEVMVTAPLELATTLDLIAESTST